MQPDTPQSINLLNTIFGIIGRDPLDEVFGVPVEDLLSPIPSFLYQSDLAFLRIARFPAAESLSDIFDRYTIIDAGSPPTSEDDFVFGSDNPDILLGLGGSDIVDLGEGDDIGRGNQGNDVLGGGEGDDLLRGGAGNDFLFGNDGNDTISGGAGRDNANGGSGRDVLRGGAGDDNLSGGGEDDHLNGGDGDDALSGGDGNDVLRGLAGRDQLNGGTGNDLLEGGEGRDVLVGGGGNDLLRGGEGDDALSVSIQLEGRVQGSSTLEGGIGDDDLRANSRAGDILFGGVGDDRTRGSLGDDTFIFRDGDGRDTIVNFGVGQFATAGFNPQGPTPQPRPEGFDLLVIDKDGFDSFEDIEGLIQNTRSGRTIIDFGDGDRIVFDNFSPLGGFVTSLPGGSTGPNLNETNIIFTSSDEYII